MIPALIVALLAGGVLAWVIQPLGSKRRRTLEETPLLVGEAEARKRAALEAIVDMEGEVAAGKLVAADFAILRNQYEVEAIRALKELDALSGADAADDDSIEEEIARLKASLTCPRCGAWKTGETCDRCHAPSP
ncbi:MAG: hypothetical protein ACR2KQ_08010 [Actinomycetota bacterium]